MKLLLAIFVFLLISPERVYAHLEKQHQLKILTLNAWMIPFQRKMGMTRARLIGTRSADYDLMLMQEVFTSEIRNRIIYYNKKSNPISQKLSALYFSTSGKLTMGRYQVTKKAFRIFSKCGGAQCLAPKGILYVQFRLPNGKLIDTFNTHLQAYQKDYLIREIQLNDLVAFINEKNDGIRPVILAGDFNIIASTAEYNILAEKLDSFQDAWLTYRGNEPGHTWNPYVNFWAKFDFEETVQNQRIDYIFLKDGQNAQWKIDSIKIAFDQPVSWQNTYVTSRDIFLSDHFGVEAILTLD